MSHAFPPVEVLHAVTSATAGPVHVSLFLAQAFAELAGGDVFAPVAPAAPVPVAGNARADIAKCRGAGLTTCAACVRSLAPAGPGQRWVEPDVDGAACALFASVECYGALYAGALTKDSA